MKYLKHINESVMDNFESALKSNYPVTVNPERNEWKEFSSQYHLYDNYYFYRDTILKVVEKESGNWFVDELSKVDIDPIEFKEKIFDRIKKLKEAFNKIPT